MTDRDLRVIGDDGTGDGRTELLLRRLHLEDAAERRQSTYDHLVRQHLPLVDAIARRYRGRGAEWDDLVQVGRLGLCKAISGFRPGQGACFLAYAVPTITGEIKRFFRDSLWDVRPPRRLQEAQLELRQHRTRLTQELGRDPTDEELARAAGITAATLREARWAGVVSSTLSIDAPTDAGSSFSDGLATGTDDYAPLEARLVLQPAFRALTSKERRILDLRFVRGWTQREIGDVLGVSQMQVCRLLQQILTKLREQLDPLSLAG